MTANLTTRYQHLLKHFQAIQQTNHLSQNVKLLAVSKYAHNQQIRALFTLGQQHFGENYWQTAKIKLAALTDLPIVWHFIGQLQKNKLADIAQHFDWIHSVAKISQLETLAKSRDQAKPLNICLQVNLSHDANKYGIMPNAVAELIEAAQSFSQLKIQGLMVLPRPGDTLDFVSLAQLREQLQNQLSIILPELSMGMSQDYQAAIKAGATWIRIGSALFND